MKPCVGIVSAVLPHFAVWKRWFSFGCFLNFSCPVTSDDPDCDESGHWAFDPEYETAGVTCSQC